MTEQTAHPAAYSDGKLICKKCDVFVGFQGASVVKKPKNKDTHWLKTHCWLCGRSEDEIKVDPYGRGEDQWQWYTCDEHGTTQGDQACCSKAVKVTMVPEDGDNDSATDAPKSKELSRWADKAMFSAPGMIDKRPTVYLLWSTPDPLGAIAAACRMYEGKPTYHLEEDISDEERRHYWEQVQKTHLKAPLEFVKLHFFIEAVPRDFTHQMVRQRTAVYAQESLRFAVKENMAKEAIYPPSLLREEGEAGINRGIFVGALEHIEEAYLALIDRGVPAEDARALLPHCVATRLNYCTDLRNLLDHAGNRLCTQAQFIWREVFLGIVKSINDYKGQITRYGIPHEGGGFTEEWTAWQFQHIAQSNVFKPICFQVGHCPFTAVFDRQCTIRERVQAGKFDEIDPREYMADPTAGRRD